MNIKNHEIIGKDERKHDVQCQGEFCFCEHNFCFGDELLGMFADFRLFGGNLTILKYFMQLLCKLLNNVIC